MFRFPGLSRRYEESMVRYSAVNELINIDFSLPISENPHAIDYVLPDYNEIKQGYVQPLSSTNENSKKNPNKQQQQQLQVSDIL